MMRYLLLLLGLSLLAGCADNRKNTGQRLDFVGNARLTSSNKINLAPADTVASRVYGVAADNELLTRLRITVQYLPKRNPFVYPTPVSAIVRDSIDKNPDPDFIYLDTLIDKRQDFVFNSVFGVRTTTGSERWQYELRDANANVQASRAFQLSTRRPDSLLTYQDYTLKLPVPASGVAARRFLQLRAGLALPAYTVLGTTTSLKTQQTIIQSLTDLIVQPDGLTLVSPDTDTTTATFKLNGRRWSGTRRATRIYRTSQTVATFATQLTGTAILNIYNGAEAAATGLGKAIGPVATGEVYAFKTGTTPARYGLLLILSVPLSTATTNTVGLQVQVRMAKD